MDMRPILAWIGFVLALMGFFSCFCWDAVFKHIIAQEFPLRPTSKTFLKTKDPDVYFYMDVYLFNWTNPQHTFDEDYKPNFVEVGPFRFRENSQRVNETWNQNKTVSFARRRFWYFEREHSIGGLDVNITTLNPIAASAAYVNRYSSYLVKLSFSSALRISQSKIWVTKTAGELLFTGFTDVLLTLASTIRFSSLPVDRFGYFYMRNGSTTPEGYFNLETAEDDISKMGVLREWNYRNRTEAFREECGMVKGSDGSHFSPRQTKEEPVWIFFPDFCKSFRFDYLEDTEVMGISGYRYAGSVSQMDSGIVDPDTWCNCNGECVPPGTLNISACQFGSPAFVSYPHFLYADPSYLEKLQGLTPNETKHRFEITIEPNTGIPIEVTARIQANLLLQPYESITMFNNVPRRIFFPMMWSEESYKIPTGYANMLKQLLAVPVMGLYLSIGLILLGLIMVTIDFIRWKLIKKHEDNGPNAQRTHILYTPSRALSTDLQGKEQRRSPNEEHNLTILRGSETR